MKKYIAHREDGTTFEIEWKDRDIPWLLEEKGESDVIAIEREGYVPRCPEPDCGCELRCAHCDEELEYDPLGLHRERRPEYVDQPPPLGSSPDAKEQVRVSPREFAERVKERIAQVPHASEELLASDYILAIADVVEELEGTK